VLVYATGQQRALMPIVMGGAVLTIVGDVALIPRLGLIGAGITVATVQPLVAAATLLLARRIVTPVVPLRRVTVGAGAVAVGCGVALHHAGWTTTAVSVTVVLYWSACALDPSVQQVVVHVGQRMGAMTARLARS
jgi:O-antigen/teichoic acid export membrane protein